jgi:hypothetical protein
LTIQNNSWKTNCELCGNKIEDGFRPTITQEFLYSEIDEKYSYLDHTYIDPLYLCKKCEEKIRQEMWEIFSDILKRQNERS